MTGLAVEGHVKGDDIGGSHEFVKRDESGVPFLYNNFCQTKFLKRKS